MFPRISEHNINAIALYEKGPVQFRLAYNWRSEFQLTPRDVIFPFASIYQPATGQLDASLFVDVNDNFTVGVQAVNLADDVTETTQTAERQGFKHRAITSETIVVTTLHITRKILTPQGRKLVFLAP